MKGRFTSECSPCSVLQAVWCFPHNVLQFRSSKQRPLSRTFDPKQCPPSQCGVPQLQHHRHRSSPCVVASMPWRNNGAYDLSQSAGKNEAWAFGGQTTSSNIAQLSGNNMRYGTQGSCACSRPVCNTTVMCAAANNVEKILLLQ